MHTPTHKPIDIVEGDTDLLVLLAGLHHKKGSHNGRNNVKILLTFSKKIAGQTTCTQSEKAWHLKLPKLVLSIVNQTDTYDAAPAGRHLEIFMQARSVETSRCGRTLKNCADPASRLICLQIFKLCDQMRKYTAAQLSASVKLLCL